MSVTTNVFHFNQSISSYLTNIRDSLSPIFTRSRRIYFRHAPADTTGVNIRYLTPATLDEEGSKVTTVANLVHLVFMASVISVSIATLALASSLLLKTFAVGLMIGCGASFAKTLPCFISDLQTSTALSKKLDELEQKSDDELLELYQSFCELPFEATLENYERALNRAKEHTRAASHIKASIGPLAMAFLKFEQYQKASQAFDIARFEFHAMSIGVRTSATPAYNKILDEFLTKKLEFAKSLVPLIIPDIDEDKVQNACIKLEIYPTSGMSDMENDDVSAYVYDERYRELVTPHLRITPHELLRRSSKEIAEKLVLWNI